MADELVYLVQTIDDKTIVSTIINSLPPSYKYLEELRIQLERKLRHYYILAEEENSCQFSNVCDKNELNICLACPLHLNKMEL